MGGVVDSITDTLFGGSDQEQSSESRVDPRFADAFFSNLERSRDVANNLGPRRIANFNNDFRAGRNQIAALEGGPAQQFVGAAGFRALDTARDFSVPDVQGQTANVARFGGASAGQAAQAQAQTAGEAARARAAAIDRGDIRNVRANSFLQGNIDQFLNPVTDNVVDVALNDLNRARQIARQGDSDAAAAAGAFGGTRQGVAEGETNRGFADAFARTSAGLRQGAFDRAAALQQSDFNRQLNAGLANQSQDALVALQNAGFTQQANLSNQQAINNRARLNAGLRQQTALANQSATNNFRQFNAGLQQQAGLSNQAAANAANQLNARLAQQADLANQEAAIQGGQLQLNAAGQLSDTGTTLQQLGLQSGAALANLGLTQRGVQQERLDSVRNNPSQQQEIINEALGLRPGGGAGRVGTSSGSGETNQGIFQPLSAGDTASGILALFSDRRLKTNVQPMEGSLDKIRALNGYDYKYVDSDKPIGGVMADEVKRTVPEAHGVHTSGYDVVDYAKLTGQLIEAVKTLVDRVEALEAKL